MSQHNNDLLSPKVKAEDEAPRTSSQSSEMMGSDPPIDASSHEDASRKAQQISNYEDHADNAFSDEENEQLSQPMFVEFNLRAAGVDDLESIDNEVLEQQNNKDERSLDQKTVLSLDGFDNDKIFKDQTNSETQRPETSIPVSPKKTYNVSHANIPKNEVINSDKAVEPEDGNDNSVLYEYDDDDEEGDWQEMPTVANSYDVYDDKGQLINNPEYQGYGTTAQNIPQRDPDAKKKPEGRTMASSKGYTRIAIESQAETYAETDKKTDFLFRSSKENIYEQKKEPLTNHNSEVLSEEEEEDEFDDYVDDTTRNALDQMQATKEMLKEEEIFAYVGLVKLLMIEMATDLAKLNASRLKNNKRLSAAQASLAIWSQKVMANLYEHMEVNKDEKKMIESLFKHGVEPTDLARSLSKIEVVDNPIFEDEEVQKDTNLVQMGPSDNIRNISSRQNLSANLEKAKEETDQESEITKQKEIKDSSGEKEPEAQHEAQHEAQTGAETKAQTNNEEGAKEKLIEDQASNVGGKTLSKEESLPDFNKAVDPDDIKNKKTLEIDVAWTVICDLFLILIYESVYDSRSRTLLMKFGECLHLKNFEICQFERRITDALEIDEGSEQTLNEKEFINYRAKKAKRKRMIYIGLAGVSGSLILGVSGGLLGPLIGAGIAAGLSTVGIAGTSGFLAGTAGTAIVTTVSTGIGAKVGTSGMMRRTGAVKTFEFKPLHNNKRVNLIITISGWMNSVVDDIRLPFSTVDPAMGDLYSLLWEPEMLTTVGQTINILATEILTQSVQQILGATVLTALMSAIQVPMALSKLGYLLDNPWNVSLDRAWNAGLILADTLLSRNLGVRPVTLVGFSIGSRLIYSCLLELAKKGAFDLVENVIIFGSPFVCNSEQLTLCRSVVSGRFISGYSKKDWILGYLFRATSGGIRRVVGLSPIEGIEGVENFDCTPYVTGHMEYRKAMPKLLKLVGWNVLSEEFIEIDEPDPEQSERQRELILEFDKNAKQILQDKDNTKKMPSNRKSGWKSWFKPKRKEWWEVYAEGQVQLQEQSKGKGNKKRSKNNKDPTKADEGSDGAAGEDGNESSEANGRIVEPADPDAEYQVFDVSELKKEINEMKKTGEIQKINEELEKTYKEELKHGDDGNT